MTYQTAYTALKNVMAFLEAKNLNIYPKHFKAVIGKLKLLAEQERTK